MCSLSARSGHRSGALPSGSALLALTGQMRHPRMSYAYITVDESQLPREVTSDARVRIARSGSPSLASYLRICRQMVPNVHHEEVVLNKEVSPFTMVLIQDGAVVVSISGIRELFHKVAGVDASVPTATVLALDGHVFDGADGEACRAALMPAVRRTFESVVRNAKDIEHGARRYVPLASTTLEQLFLLGERPHQ